ncbi:hypothetical protein [Gorillibacterium timonense]|uniref:hypothetical protein n=1 Tax=Gorillibacterium timonense TaxID=1689269 RepID=UPI00071D1725|nr:hypothetical protein [Gorillibacterium timonense]
MAGAADSGTFLIGMTGSTTKALAAFDRLSARLSGMVQQFNQAASRMDEFAEKMTKTSNAMAKAIAAQNELVTSVEELATAQKENLNTAKDMTEGIKQMQDQLQKTATASDTFDVTKDGAASSGTDDKKSGSSKDESEVKDTGKEDGNSKRKEKGPGFFNRMASSLKGMAGTAFSMIDAKQLAMNSIGGAMDNQRMRDQFIIRTGSNQEGGSMYDELRKQAVRSGGNVNDSLKGSLQMLNQTQDAGQIAKLTGLAQRMAAFDPNGGGIADAMSVMNDAMAGNMDSLAARLQIPKDVFKEMNLEGMAKGKDWDGLSKTVDRLLSNKGMSEEHYKVLQQEPGQQWNAVKTNATAALQDAGQGALAALQPFFTMINDAFQEGKFQPFFDALAIGFQFIGGIATDVASFILAHLDTVKLILLAIGIVAAAVGAIMFISWLSSITPIILLIGLVAGLLFGLNEMGVSVSDVVSFIMGILYGLFAFLWDRFAALYNSVLAVAEFLINIFIDPVYAIQKLFYDLVLNVVEFFNGMINGLIDGLNWILSKISKVTGKDMEIKGSINLAEKMAGTKPVSDKNVVSLDKYRMMSKDIGLTAEQGAKVGSGFTDNLSAGTDKLKSFGKGWDKQLDPTDNMKKFGAGAGASPAVDSLSKVGAASPALSPNIDNVGHVGSIGKVDDTVDVSSDDLEMMHDIAEMSSIQNFVSLTPTVNVTTGDIKNGYDIDTIINRIQVNLENEIASSAQGVYG